MELDEWVELGGQRLAKFAVLVCADRDLAQEVVQDVLCHAILRWDRIQTARDIDAYMRRSVINRRNSVLRRTRLRREVRPHPSRPAPGPEEQLELWDACARLRPRYRDALVLRFYTDLTYAEVAEVLNVRETKARGYVMRALHELRTQWVRADKEVEANDR